MEKEWEIPKFPDVLKTTDSYVIDGKDVPRVTNISGMLPKPWLYFWYGKHGTKKCKAISQKALRFGAVFHRLAQLRMDGQKVNIKQHQKPMRGCYHAFIKWRKQHIFGHVEAEVILHNQKYGYAGTADIAATIDGKVGIVDWKTSKDIYLEHLLQVAAYMVTFKEMTGVTPDFGGVLIVKKNGKFLYYQFSWKLAEQLHHYFLAELRLWHFQQKDWMSKTHEVRG